jgi:short-subunit dehydrogenase
VSGSTARRGELAGETVLVTGAAGLVGGHLGAVLAERGANLALTDVDAEQLEERARELRDRGTGVAVLECDLMDADQLEALAERVERALAPVDVLVNNAYAELTSRFDRLTREELDVQIDVNFRAPLALTRSVLPQMLERGRGHVVNVASLTGKLAFSHKAHYTAAKAGLIAFSHALSRELAAEPVGVSVVSPALVDEGGVSEAAREGGVEPPRLAGTCSPRDVAEAVADSILDGKVERTVSSRPTALLSALQASAPSLAWRVLRLSGMPRYWETIARQRGRA